MKLYQVDAFTSQKFSGNPAGVMLVDDFPTTEAMQNIALEMNISETAFIKLRQEDEYDIRYFTPAEEVDICGHATLSCTHILFSQNEISGSEIVFYAKEWELRVEKSEKWYQMSFPRWDFTKVDDTGNAEEITNIKNIQEVYSTDRKWRIILIDDVDALKRLSPDFWSMKGTDYWNIAVVCRWDNNYDYYIRCFVTDCGINEDPVTGSIECVVAPLWAERLQKNKMKVFQCSQRWWEKWVEVTKDSVIISGEAVTIFEIDIL